MLSGQKIDRRKAKFRVFRLEQPFFMQVPKSLAASSLAGLSLIIILSNQLAPTILFGPFFLLICAFSAWFVGNIFAVLLGIFIVTIQVLSGNAISLNDEPIVMALQLCSALAVVLMLGVARAALEIEWRFARTDALTGALNRKAFFEAVECVSGQKGTTVLCFADLNGLKRLNDRLGHEAGDVALQDFAGRVRKAIRKDDVFARIGGDEFVILQRVHDTAAADLVAQRLNRMLNLDPVEGETNLKCSLGVVVLPAGSRSIDAELKQADTLMYHAKRENLGLMVAISIKGDMQELIPFAPSTTSNGQQRAAIRSTGRITEFAARSGPSDNPVAT